MSLESFLGFDSNEPMSDSAFEAFKEKMAAAAAQIAAIKKEENKQKKKETDLLKILLRFVKKSQKKELALLISRALEQNVPANFVLAIILLGNDDIKQEVGGDFLMLTSSKEDHPESIKSEERTLVFFRKDDESLPLKIKIELDHWIKGLLSQAEETPQKLLKNAYDIEIVELPHESYEEPRFKEKKEIKSILIELTAFVINDFLAQNKAEEPYTKIKNFAEFIIKGILTKTQENLKNRGLLSDKTF